MSDTVLGVLVSGRGSNLQSIIDNIKNGSIKAQISVVISDKPDAYALERANREGIEAVCIDRKQYASRAEFEAQVLSVLQKHKAELIVLAGFMRILSPEFICQFSGRIMNIHPALLPAFPGLNAQGQAISYGAKVSGCTVHFVDDGMDTGPIILQQAVPVYDDDTEDTLAERIIQVEHVLYPKAIALFCDQKLIINGRRVRVSIQGGPK